MLPTRLIVAEKLWSQLLWSWGCGGKKKFILQAETTGIPLKAAKYDQVSTLVFNGGSPLINPGLQGAVQSLPPPLPKILISLTSLCMALGTCQRLGSQESWQGLRTPYGRASCSSDKMKQGKSALHPSPPQCSPLHLVPPAHAGDQPTAFGPTWTGHPGKAPSAEGSECLKPMAKGLSAAKGQPETRPLTLMPAPSPSGVQGVTSLHRVLLYPSLER